MIIDAHIHLWDKVNGRLGRVAVKPFRDGVIRIGAKRVQGMPSWLTDCRNPAELALAAMDDAGVGAAVVTQEYLDGEQNDYLLSVKRRYPSRFFVHGLIDFRRPAGVQAQFDRLVRRGFKGIKCPAMFLPQLKTPVCLDDPRLMAVWERMAELGMVLSIDLAAGDGQTPAMRRILKRFAKLKVAVGHFGMAGHGNWMSQIRLAEFDNVYIECGGIIWLYRHEGPPFKQAQARIQQAYRAVGAGKLMWGSDYPRTMVDFTYRQSLDWATGGCEFMTKSEKANFLGGNAARLYGFKRSAKHNPPRVRITEL